MTGSGIASAGVTSIWPGLGSDSRNVAAAPTISPAASTNRPVLSEVAWATAPSVSAPVPEAPWNATV